MILTDITIAINRSHCMAVFLLCQTYFFSFVLFKYWSIIYYTVESPNPKFTGPLQNYQLSGIQLNQSQVLNLSCKFDKCGYKLLLSIVIM